MKEYRSQKHKKVFICSPFHPRGDTAGQRAEDLRHNRQRARLACEYAVSHGYLPLAPHLFFPTFLAEDAPGERELGIQFGLEWLSECDELWIIGRRITEGMKREIAAAKEMNIPVAQHILCQEVEGSLLDQFFSKQPHSADPGYEEDTSYYYKKDDEEEGLIYDGD